MTFLFPLRSPEVHGKKYVVPMTEINISVLKGGRTKKIKQCTMKCFFFPKFPFLFVMFLKSAVVRHH